MFKDLAEQRDRVEEGGLVLGQDLPLAFEVGLDAAENDVPQLDSSHLQLSDLSKGPGSSPAELLTLQRSAVHLVRHRPERLLGVAKKFYRPSDFSLRSWLTLLVNLQPLNKVHEIRDGKPLRNG